MSGGDFHEVVQQIDLHSNMAQEQMALTQKAYTEIPAIPDSHGVGHNIVHIITDSGGVWYLLGFAFLGLLTIFKKRIRNWLGIGEVKK